MATSGDLEARLSELERNLLSRKAVERMIQDSEARQKAQLDALGAEIDALQSHLNRVERKVDELQSQIGSLHELALGLSRTVSQLEEGQREFVTNLISLTSRVNTLSEGETRDIEIQERLLGLIEDLHSRFRVVSRMILLGGVLSGGDVYPLASSEVDRLLEGLDSELQIVYMEGWFFHFFEDPAHESFHDSEAEYGYAFQQGGPYYAEEELRERFEEVVGQAPIVELLEELSGLGFVWAPTRHHPGHTDNA